MKHAQTQPPLSPQHTGGSTRVYLPLVSGGSGTPPSLKAADVVRFLAQAGWGAAPEDIDPLIQSGLAAWIETQKALPVSLTRPYLDAIVQDLNTNNPPADSVPYARPGALTNKSALAINLGTAWMRNIIFGKDQLRQRVTWALSQIMVTSFDGLAKLNDTGQSMADYYDTLAQNAFGTFRDLLLAVSVHPVMSFFLSSLGNEKPVPANNQYPDENYAREVMQLFTIGLWELNPDGSQKLGAQNNPIPTYDNKDIENMARVFTGLWFAGKKWPVPGGNFTSSWLADFKLAMFEDQHDKDPKTIFHGKPWQMVLLANNTGMQDIQAAIDALVNHPNTGPFIAHALIKFLVTSNPSSAYVGRVAAVFANNGAGVRGDLFAVVKALLLDDEARSPASQSNPRFGKLQEPLVRVTRMVRAFGAGKTTPDLQWWGADKSGALDEWPLFAPSVFNFFSPNFRHLGVLAQAGLTSPEFQILDSVTVATVSNKFAEFVDSLLHKRLNGGTPQFKFDVLDYRLK